MRKIPVLAVCTFVLLAAIGHSRARAAEGEQLNFVTTGELKSMMDKGEKFVLINALSPLEYTQTKIEGAVNIPFGKLKKGESILPEDKKSKLIFYCMGPKWTKSKKAAGLAVKMGYGNVFVYDEGFPAWIKAGYPYDTLNILPKVKIPAVDGAALKAMIDDAEDIVILDVRDSKDLGAGRIAGALNITLEDMMARYKEIPTGKKVVIVDLHGKQTQITGRYLLKQGYTSVVQLDKGMKAGWIEAGYPVE